MQRTVKTPMKGRPKSSINSAYTSIPKAQSSLSLLRKEVSSVNNSQGCVLNKEDLPIISTMEHAVSYCLCHLCTCGLHHCPGQELKKAMCRSGYTSTYKHSYKQVPPQPISRIKQHSAYKSVSPNQLLTTTHQEDYKPNPLPQVQTTIHTQTIAQNIPFEGRSSVYRREYPDWKVPGAVVYRQIHNHYDGTLRHRYIKSTYKDSFNQTKTDNSKSVPRLIRKTQVENPTLVNLSTAKSSFDNKYKAGEIMNPKATKNSQIQERLVEYANRFKTVYNEQFRETKSRYLSRKKLINF